jgi:hypothetical protein
MTKTRLIIFFVLTPWCLFAQHCPWDCIGLVQLQTTIPKATVYRLHPVLVDENKQIIIDTMYGTNKPAYDSCWFLFEADFTKYRERKIAIHQWYQYDTFYHFAAGFYIVQYNFCKYQGEKLYLRYTDPYSTSYHYVEVPQEMRIHLHDYNNQMRENKTDEIKKDVRNSILTLDCAKWSLKKQDCTE